MKSKDIFEQTGDEISDDILMDIDFSDMNFSDLTEFEIQFNPIQVQIDDSVIVDLVQNVMVVRTAPWGEMIDFINENYEKMNGTYNIAKNGGVLHTFVISR